MEKEITINHTASFSDHGQFQKKFRKILNIPENVKSVSIEYNGVEYPKLTLASDGERILFNKEKLNFISNNQNLKEGEPFKIKVKWDDPSPKSVPEPPVDNSEKKKEVKNDDLPPEKPIPKNIIPLIEVCVRSR